MRPTARVPKLTLTSVLLAAPLGCSHGHTRGDGHAHGPHGHGHAEHHSHSHEHGHPHPHSDPHGPGHFADPTQYVANWNDPARDAWQKPAEIVAALGLKPGSVVVDIGSGTGYLLPPLGAAVGPSGQVLALDVEPAMLQYLTKAVAEAGWSNVRVHPAKPDDPLLAADSIDGAVALNVWHHVADRVGYAKKLAQSLRPGGSFVVVDFLKAQTEGFGPPLAMRLTADEVVADLRAAGLQAEVLPETMPRHYVVRGRRPAAQD